MTQPQLAKVAIIGGGCAAISTAFELSRPEHQDRFQVTVYQLGWRLGGKGASGRGKNGRIEEHGLHVWLGFYENAFRLMRECYTELARDPATCRIASWDQAFIADPYVGIADLDKDGNWLQWTALFPDAEGLPGDELTASNPFTVLSYLRRTFALLKTLVFSVDTHHAEQKLGGTKDRAQKWDEAIRTPEGVAQLFNRVSRYGVLGATTGLIEVFAILDMAVRLLTSTNDSALINLLKNNLVSQAMLEFLRSLSKSARAALEKSVGKNDENRYTWEIIDLVVAIMVGILREGLITDPRGFDAIDDKECREWLLEHGASPRAVNSAFVRGLFDLAMAYRDGDENRPELAAGQAIRGSLRMFFTCRGSFFWKMRAGMGDIVFAPFYEVLKKRGVRFEFFHRLENVGLSEDGEYVESLKFDVQAKVRCGNEYQPLIDIDGLPCWPSVPDFTQLENGSDLQNGGVQFESFWDRRKVEQKTLKVIDDFDFVVLGVGIGAIPYLCGELLERSERWRDMVEHVVTVPSQAFQLWMREDMATLGWKAPPPTLSAFAKPFDTWADMRHLIDEERWPERPQAIAYFCGVLSDTDFPSTREDDNYAELKHQEVKENAVEFLRQHIGHLWPNAFDESGEFKWEILIDPDGDPASSDQTAFDSQFWTANVNPSDRYTLAPPGSIKFRLSPLDNRFDNLTIAGDWTACGFNEGCVEAAVMSGRLAAHALSGYPALDQIIGYDHP